VTCHASILSHPNTHVSKMMFKTALRAATVAGRSAIRPASSPAARAFSVTARIRSDHGAPPPQLYGPGSKAGDVPTDELQATGLERLQLLGEMEGVSVFDTNPLESDRIGTKANPILVPSLVRLYLVFE
jgi:cytochrome c oxidase subunit 5b